MSLIRTIEPMDRMPRGFGAAYRKADSFLGVIAPVPLNLPVGAIHSAWGWLRSAPIAWESPRNRIARKAYRRGHAAGFKVGKKHGYCEWLAMRDRRIIELEAGRDAAMQAFDRFADRLTGREK